MTDMPLNTKAGWSAAAPNAMLLAVDAPLTATPMGYSFSVDVLTATYDSGGVQLLPVPDFTADDLDMEVYPAVGPSPCPSIGNILSTFLGSGSDDPVSCTVLPSGRWLVTGQPESTATTQVERYGDYFVALTVDTQSLTPISPSRLPALFASLHHADDAELAAIEQYTTFWP